ncbi:MAG: 4-hydroxy-3-methylbut-2-enyl diphosphate reductase [Lachnospiraceae bacterium]|nr:4-hydroxy-3-methylbut-2-enyl diphosphate reductase [Lachnospiraceae bacterium]
MEILLAENAGFCFGVEKAVDAVYAQLADQSAGTVFTYGEIVHNEAVTKDLAAKGVKTAESAKDIRGALEEAKNGGGAENACVVIRAHGVGAAVYDTLKEQQLRVVDATCPFVRRIHETVRKAGEAGETVIVVGDHDHPEVQGIVGWAKGPIAVVSSPEEAAALDFPRGSNLTIVSQTTFRRHKFKETVEVFSGKEYNVNIVDTICSATSVRQEEAERIASEADVMIVVGGAHSSNTRKLYEICKGKCSATYLVQHAGDLNTQMFEGAARVGITAGASTPKNIIQEVQTYVRTRSEL